MKEIYEISDYRSAEKIAAEINIIKDQTFKTVIMNSIEIGKKLCEAKELVSHGEWGNWLKEKVSYSQDTANNLMKIYREYGNDQLDIFDNPNSEMFKNLGYSQAVALLAIPKEERTEFAEEHKVDELTIKELKAEIEDYKNKNKQLSEQLNEAKDIDEEALKETIKAELETDLNKAKEEAKAAEAEKKEANKKLRDIKKQMKEAEKKAKKAENEKSDLISQLDITKKKAAEEAETKSKEELEQLKKAKEEAENKIRELEQKTKTLASGDIQKLQAHFEIFQRTFTDMLAIIDKIENAEEAEKLKTGINKMLDNMSQNLE